MSITLSALQQQRRDTAANWTSQNPTLLAGELGYETDTGYFKIGDGSTAWTKTRVFFPVCYDGAEWVGSAPRNPSDEVTEHQGSW